MKRLDLSRHLVILPAADEVAGGNVFTGISLSTGGVPIWPLPMMYWTSHVPTPPSCCDIWWPLLTTQVSTPRKGKVGYPAPSDSDSWWWSLDTCSNLFIWGPSPPPPPTPPPEWNLWWTLKHTVSRQVVRILMECFLVFGRLAFLYCKHFTEFVIFLKGSNNFSQNNLFRIKIENEQYTCIVMAYY